MIASTFECRAQSSPFRKTDVDDKAPARTVAAIKRFAKSGIGQESGELRHLSVLSSRFQQTPPPRRPLVHQRTLARSLPRRARARERTVARKTFRTSPRRTAALGSPVRDFRLMYAAEPHRSNRRARHVGDRRALVPSARHNIRHLKKGRRAHANHGCAGAPPSSCSCPPSACAFPYPLTWHPPWVRGVAGKCSSRRLRWVDNRLDPCASV
jgi:hypothetical protein